MRLVVSLVIVVTTFWVGQSAIAEGLEQRVTELESIIEDLRPDPSLYYPNKRYEPNFSLEIPTLAGSWVGMIQDDTYRATTGARLNFISRYSPSQHAYLGVYINFSADVTAYIFSGGDMTYLYGFYIRHHNNYEWANISYSIDPVLRETYWPDTSWQNYAPANIISIAVDAVYEFMEFDSGTTKTCTGINLHLESAEEVIVTGTGCFYR